MTATAIRKEKKVSIVDCLQAVAHVEGQAYVEEGQDGEGVAEGAMDDVPEFEDLLGAREEEDALGEGGLFASDRDGVFHAVIVGAAQTADGDEPGAEAGYLKTQQGDLEGALEVNGDHANESEESRHVLYVLGRRKIVENFEALAEGEFLRGKILAKGRFDVLQLFHGEFGGVEVARDLRIEITADETGESDAKHAPESPTGDVAEFKGSVKRDDERREGSENHVKIEPMA